MLAGKVSPEVLAGGKGEVARLAAGKISPAGPRRRQGRGGPPCSLARSRRRSSPAARARWPALPPARSRRRRPPAARARWPALLAGKVSPEVLAGGKGEVARLAAGKVSPEVLAGGKGEVARLAAGKVSPEVLAGGKGEVARLAAGKVSPEALAGGKGEVARLAAGKVSPATLAGGKGEVARLAAGKVSPATLAGGKGENPPGKLNVTNSLASHLTTAYKGDMGKRLSRKFVGTFVCDMCGKDFLAYRIDAACCGATCRKRKSRENLQAIRRTVGSLRPR